LNIVNELIHLAAESAMSET